MQLPVDATLRQRVSKTTQIIDLNSLPTSKPARGCPQYLSLHSQSRRATRELRRIVSEAVGDRHGARRPPVVPTRPPASRAPTAIVGSWSLFRSQVVGRVGTIADYFVSISPTMCVRAPASAWIPAARNLCACSNASFLAASSRSRSSVKARMHAQAASTK
jgi:hypothetical protein